MFNKKLLKTENRIMRLHILYKRNPTSVIQYSKYSPLIQRRLYLNVKRILLILRKPYQDTRYLKLNFHGNRDTPIISAISPVS